MVTTLHPMLLWVLLLLLLIIASSFSCTTVQVEAAAFKCRSSSNRSRGEATTCDAIIDYVSANATTLSALKSLFNVNNLRSILGANNLPLATPPTHTLPANHTLKIPFPCLCANGTGRSNKVPLYTVVPGDGLYHIAAEVFGNLVTYQEIQAANNITNPELIFPGQSLWVPLPCSCDEVDGEKVVHYGYSVPAGSSLEAIARQYNTSQDTLLKLNGGGLLTTPKDLKAGAVLDVPLPTCKSMISNESLDYPLLVPNGTYVFTAANCVMCKCDAAAANNNWNLECKRTEMKSSSLWAKCPSSSTPCQLGSSSNCAYAGYTNQTILTVLLNNPTSPQNAAAGSKTRLQSNYWEWFLLLIAVSISSFTYLY